MKPGVITVNTKTFKVQWNSSVCLVNTQIKYIYYNIIITSVHMAGRNIFLFSSLT